MSNEKHQQLLELCENFRKDLSDLTGNKFNGHGLSIYIHNLSLDFFSDKCENHSNYDEKNSIVIKSKYESQMEGQLNLFSNPFEKKVVETITIK